MPDPPTSTNHNLPLVPAYGEPNASEYENEWGTIYRENGWSYLDESLVARDTQANRTNYEPYPDAIYWATDTGAVYTGDGTSWTLRDAEFSGLVANSLSVSSAPQNANDVVRKTELDDLSSDVDTVSSELSNHESDSTNPHGVTNSQVGAPSQSDFDSLDTTVSDHTSASTGVHGLASDEAIAGASDLDAVSSSLSSHESASNPHSESASETWVSNNYNDYTFSEDYTDLSNRSHGNEDHSVNYLDQSGDTVSGSLHVEEQLSSQDGSTDRKHYFSKQIPWSGGTDEPSAVLLCPVDDYGQRISGIFTGFRSENSSTTATFQTHFALSIGSDGRDGALYAETKGYLENINPADFIRFEYNGTEYYALRYDGTNAHYYPNRFTFTGVASEVNGTPKLESVPLSDGTIVAEESPQGDLDVQANELMVPEGVITEQGDRVATRPWANSNFNDYTFSEDYTDLSNRGHGNEDHSATFATESYADSAFTNSDAVSAVETAGALSLSGDVDISGNDLTSVNTVSGPFGQIGFDGSTFNVDVTDSTIDARYRDANNDTIAWFRQGGNVEVPNGQISEQGNRVATRAWANSNFNNYSFSESYTDLSNRSHGNEDHSATFATESYVDDQAGGGAISGTASATGDGSATQFTWGVSTSSTITWASIEPTTGAASVDYQVIVDNTNNEIGVEYATAPADGESLEWVWALDNEVTSVNVVNHGDEAHDENYASTSTDASSFAGGSGSSGQVLHTDGTDSYWGNIDGMEEHGNEMHSSDYYSQGDEAEFNGLVLPVGTDMYVSSS